MPDRRLTARTADEERPTILKKHVLEFRALADGTRSGLSDSGAPLVICPRSLAERVILVYLCEPLLQLLGRFCRSEHVLEIWARKCGCAGRSGVRAARKPVGVSS